ncbi:MAG TPA: methyltransferase domain-containing protein [Thermomicrobiales bacterium]
MADLDAIKARQKQVWGAGNYSVIATALYSTAEVLCEDVNVPAGARVLDIACGSGNVALAAARRRAEVVGIDFVPSLLDHARERAAAEWLEVDFREADAEALPFPDASFDVVLSAFGVMFATDAERAAQEMIRVCRPGGRIGLANWTPASAVTEIFQLAARYLPPPGNPSAPSEWGTAERLRELFGDRARSMRLRDHVWLDRAVSVDHLVDLYRTYLGPIAEAVTELDETRAGELQDGLRAIVQRHNRATDGTAAMACQYVTVVIDL